MQRCLAKRAADRPRSAAELLDELGRLSGRLTEPAAVALGSGRLFGRASEMTRICDVLQTVASGRAAILAIHGEAGVGKSVLVEDARLVAGPLGFVWLSVSVTKSGGLIRPLLAAARPVLAPGFT